MSLFDFLPTFLLSFWSAKKKPESPPQENKIVASSELPTTQASQMNTGDEARINNLKILITEQEKLHKSIHHQFTIQEINFNFYHDEFPSANYTNAYNEIQTLREKNLPLQKTHDSFKSLQKKASALEAKAKAIRESIEEKERLARPLQEIYALRNQAANLEKKAIEIKTSHNYKRLHNEYEKIKKECKSNINLLEEKENQLICQIFNELQQTQKIIACTEQFNALQETKNDCKKTIEEAKQEIQTIQQKYHAQPTLPQLRSEKEVERFLIIERSNLILCCQKIELMEKLLKQILSFESFVEMNKEKLAPQFEAFDKTVRATDYKKLNLPDEFSLLLDIVEKTTTAEIAKIKEITDQTTTTISEQKQKINACLEKMRASRKLHETTIQQYTNEIDQIKSATSLPTTKKIEPTPTQENNRFSFFSFSWFRSAKTAPQQQGYQTQTRGARC